MSSVNFKIRKKKTKKLIFPCAVFSDVCATVDYLRVTQLIFSERKIKRIY